MKFDPVFSMLPAEAILPSQPVLGQCVTMGHTPVTLCLRGQVTPSKRCSGRQAHAHTHFEDKNKRAHPELDMFLERLLGCTEERGLLSSEAITSLYNDIPCNSNITVCFRTCKNKNNCITASPSVVHLLHRNFPFNS